MINLRWKIAAGFIALQVAFFAGWAAFEQMRLMPGEGKSILLKVVPVDPRDLISGQYMNLSYEFSRINRSTWQGPDPAEGDTVYAVLTEKDGFYVPRLMSKERPGRFEPGDVVMKGRADNWMRVSFGDIERYYVPEGTPTPNMRELTVRIRVGGDYDPRIEEVYLNGKRWP